MWPIGAFFMGLFSLGAAGVSSVKETYKHAGQEADYKNGNYNPGIQWDFENVTDGFDFELVSNEIRKRMPSSNEMFIHGLAKAAISKKLMEENSTYNFQIPDKFYGYPMDEFTKDIFRTIVTGSDVMIGSLIYKSGYRVNNKKKYLPKKVYMYKKVSTM